jgi:hypothetical protein
MRNSSSTMSSNSTWLSLLQPTRTTLTKGTLHFVLQKNTKKGKEAVSYKTLNQRHQDPGASKERHVIYTSLLQPQINHFSCGFIKYGLFRIRSIYAVHVYLFLNSQLKSPGKISLCGVSVSGRL